MAYNTKSIITDKDGNPISQYYNPDTDEYEQVEGIGGGNKVIVYNEDGTQNDVSLLSISEKLGQLTGSVIDEETRKGNELIRIDNEDTRISNESNREQVFGSQMDRVGQIEEQVPEQVIIDIGKLPKSVNDILPDENGNIDLGEVVEVVNNLDEEIEGKALDATQGKILKDDLGRHKAESVSQNTSHDKLNGSISHLTNTGVVSNVHSRQVNVSSNSTASGTNSQVNASSDNSTASGTNSQVNASGSSTASGTNSQVNASWGAVADGRMSSILSSGRYTYSDRGGSIPAGTDNAMILASYGIINNQTLSIAGGYNDTGTDTTAGRKWHIFSKTGDIEHSGTLSTGHNFTDFAELFPNLTNETQGYGLLQTIDGFGVRPANDGESVIGVTSATAGIILGNTPFSWADRWLKDEWGDYITEDGEIITQPIENPDWDSEQEQVSRLDRPDEWSVVGLVGQVYVRLKEDVVSMDYVKSWNNGIGQKSEQITNVRVMKITQEYDAEKGYKVGFCLLK